MSLALSVSTILSLLISLCSHPLSLGLMILLQSVAFCSITRIITNSSWIPLTIFIVMVGGLMIIFIYMTSISSNEYFSRMKINKMSLYFILTLPFMELTYFYPLENYENLMNELFNKEYFKIFSLLNFQTSIFSFIYLIITLIVMINLLSVNKGPMRKKY